MPAIHESEFVQNEARAELVLLQPIYQASAEVRRQNQDKTFTGIAGPFGVGKSTNTDAAIALQPEIQPILSTVTRERKPGNLDPAGFKTADEGVTFTSMLQAARNQELVNFSVIPGGHVYGTYPEDFPSKYTIGPFLPTSIDHIAKGGFENYNFVYLVATGELWKHYVLTTRKNLPAKIYKSRVKEAKDSIEFALENTNLLRFVENLPAEIDLMTGEAIYPAAKTISQIAIGRSAETLELPIAKQRLQEMYSVIKELK